MAGIPDKQHHELALDELHGIIRWQVASEADLAALAPAPELAGRVAARIGSDSAWWLWSGAVWLQLADRAWVLAQIASAVAGEADAAWVTSLLASKADTTWVTQQLATKADSSALSAKADQSSVTTLQTQVAGKADQSTVSTLQTQVASKADTTWVTQQLAAASHWRITQALNAQGAGTIAFHIGSWSFSAGAQLAGLLILGTQGAPGNAIAELVRDDTGAVVATWTSTASLGAVSLAAPITLAAGIHSLRVRGQLDNSQPLLRGIDWTVT